MRLKPSQGLLLVDNSNSNNYRIGEVINEKLNNSDSTTSDTNSNSQSTVNQNHAVNQNHTVNQNLTQLTSDRSENWKGWEDNRQGHELNQASQPNLNSPDYPEVSTSSSGSSEEDCSSDWEVEELPKTGFVNPNYPGFQHLANTEQTGFPRDLSLDSLEGGSNPLSPVSECASTSDVQEPVVLRVDAEEIEKEIDNRPNDIWNEVRELSSKVPCSLEQIISEKEEEDKWKESHFEEDSIKLDPFKDLNVYQTEESWKETAFDTHSIRDFEEVKDEPIDNREVSNLEQISLNESSSDESEKKDLEKDVINQRRNSDDNNNDGKVIEGVNKLDETEVKDIYSKAKLNIPLEEEEIKPNNMEVVEDSCLPQECLRPIVKPAESTRTEYQRPNSLKSLDCARPAESKPECIRPVPKYPDSCRSMDNNKSEEHGISNDTNRLEKGEREAAPKKKEKTEINMNVKKMTTSQKQSPRSSKGALDYKIETVMPQIDLEAIESHLRAAREEERRRRNEREEIRRRLATGDLEDLPPTDRPGKKPSLQSRLQSGMNLQICFMNDAMSDSESPGSDSSPHSLPPTPKSTKTSFPRSLPSYPQNGVDRGRAAELSEAGRLQAEARAALSQAQGLARMQMHQERRRLQTSPITDMLRNSLRKVGVELAEGRRRLSRQLLTDMNVAQLQVIVNDLHTQIESLNEGLVKYLMERDELHMGQDSMLVDIEDLTRYLGAKENLLKEEMAQNNINQNNNNHVAPSKPVITRIVSLGKK